MRNSYKYTKMYSGGEPVFTEADVFTIVIPLSEAATATVGPTTQDGTKVPRQVIPQDSGESIKRIRENEKERIECTENALNRELNAQEKIIVSYLAHNKTITSAQLIELLDIKRRRAQVILTKMVADGILNKRGASRSTIYVLNETGLQYRC